MLIVLLFLYLKKKNPLIDFQFYYWVKFGMLASQTWLTDNPFLFIQLSVLIVEVWLIFKRHMHHMRFRKWLFKIDWSIQERWVELSSSVKTNNDSAIIELMEQSQLSSKSVYWSQNGVYVQPTFKIKPRFLNEDPILLWWLYPESTFKLQSIPWYDNFQVSGAVPEHLE